MRGECVLYNRDLPHRQVTAWLSAALIPTVIQLTSGASWLSVLIACIVSLLCIWIRWAFGEEPKGKMATILQWAFLTVVLGMSCKASAQSWPGGSATAVGIILLLLALWSVSKGISASASVGCVLFWFVLLLYMIILGAGVKDVQIEWLKPTKSDVDPFASVLLLTPAAGAIQLSKKETPKHRLLLIGVFCTIAAAVTSGVLSAQVAERKDYAFYEMTRSLNLLGQARRFEAVLSAAMTAGWFSLLSFYLAMCAKLAEKLRPGSGKVGSVAASLIAAVFVLFNLHIPELILLVLGAVFWVLLPLLTQGLVIIKKSQKNKNNA